MGAAAACGSHRRGRTLPRAFYDRDALHVAPELLNKVLVYEQDGVRISARLVEVEAYRGRDDPGSHAYRGETPRNATMFARPASLYVYFTYGMHWCANAVCGPGNAPHAVLLRAASPLDGVELMRERRPKARTDAQLLAGPARLTQAFGLGREHDGLDLSRGPVRIVDDGVPPPRRAHVTTRVGIAEGRGDTARWRFTVPGDPNVSHPRHV